MQDIDKNAPLICRTTILIDSSIEVVWQTISDVNNWSEWQRDITYSKIEVPFQSGAQFKWASKRLGIKTELHTVNPVKEFGWIGRAVGCKGIHNWHFERKDNKTEVVVIQSLTGIPARILKRTLNRIFTTRSNRWLLALKKECERVSSPPSF